MSMAYLFKNGFKGYPGPNGEIVNDWILFLNEKYYLGDFKSFSNDNMGTLLKEI